MANARAQINGVTYDLKSDYNSQSISELAEKLEPKSEPAPHDGPRLRPFDSAGSVVYRLEVLLEGVPASLVIRLDRVWASAAWLIE